MTVVLDSKARSATFWFYDFGQVIWFLRVIASFSVTELITIPI